MTRADAPPPPTGDVAQVNDRELTDAFREYERLMRLGLEEYRAARWGEARALFRQGHSLLPNARSFRVLGMTAFNLKEYVRATRELSAALGDPRRPLTPELRAETQALLERANIFVSVYHLNLVPVTAQLWVDGVLAEREPNGDLMLSVGRHHIEAVAPGYSNIHRPIVADGTDGETLRIHLREVGSPRPYALSPASAASAPPLYAGAPVDASPRAAGSEGIFKAYPLSLTTASAALAFGGASLAFYISALRESRKLERRCTPLDDGCERGGGLTDARDQRHAISMGLLTGAVSLTAAAVVLYFVERARRPGRRSRARAALFTVHPDEVSFPEGSPARGW